MLLDIRRCYFRVCRVPWPPSCGKDSATRSDYRSVLLFLGTASIHPDSPTFQGAGAPLGNPPVLSSEWPIPKGVKPGFVMFQGRLDERPYATHVFAVIHARLRGIQVFSLPEFPGTSWVVLLWADRDQGVFLLDRGFWVCRPGGWEQTSQDVRQPACPPKKQKNRPHRNTAPSTR